MLRSLKDIVLWPGNKLLCDREGYYLVPREDTILCPVKINWMARKDVVCGPGRMLSGGQKGCIVARKDVVWWPPGRTLWPGRLLICGQEGYCLVVRKNIVWWPERVYSGQEGHCLVTR